MLTARAPERFVDADEDKTSFDVQVFEVKSDCISLCIIDDCRDSDVPLLEFSLSELYFRHELESALLKDELVMPKPILPPPVEDNASTASIDKHFGTQICAILAGDYYNRALSGWEPFIEPWK